MAVVCHGRMDAQESRCSGRTGRLMLITNSFYKTAPRLLYLWAPALMHVFNKVHPRNDAPAYSGEAEHWVSE
jgi:hypothetical protein